MIYYVEDDKNIRDLVVYTLKQTGLAARGFAYAEEFDRACEEQMPVSYTHLDVYKRQTEEAIPTMQIVTDYAADISPEQLDGFEVHYLPLTITIDGKVYRLSLIHI